MLASIERDGKAQPSFLFTLPYVMAPRRNSAKRFPQNFNEITGGINPTSSLKVSLIPSYVTSIRIAILICPISCLLDFASRVV